MLLWKTEEWGAGVGEQAPLRISKMFINPHQKVSRAENNYRHFKHSLSIVFLLGFILQRVRWRSIALRTLSDRYFPHNPGLLKPAVDAHHTPHCAQHTLLTAHHTAQSAENIAQMASLSLWTLLQAKINTRAHNAPLEAAGLSLACEWEIVPSNTRDCRRTSKMFKSPYLSNMIFDIVYNM